jgi:hypothetical protein
MYSTNFFLIHTSPMYSTNYYVHTKMLVHNTSMYSTNTFLVLLTTYTNKYMPNYVVDQYYHFLLTTYKTKYFLYI